MFLKLFISGRKYIKIFWVWVGFPKISRWGGQIFCGKKKFDFPKITQFSVKIYLKKIWAQTFSTRSLPGPNFFKPSVPCDLRVFRAFASLFLFLSRIFHMEHWLLFHQNIAIISSVAANEFHFRLQSFLVWSLARLLCVDKWLFWIKGRLISIQKKYPQKIFDVANKIFTGLFWYIFLTGFVCSYCLERLFYLFLLIDSFGDSFLVVQSSLFIWKSRACNILSVQNISKSIKVQPWVAYSDSEKGNLKYFWHHIISFPLRDSLINLKPNWDVNGARAAERWMHLISDSSPLCTLSP